MTRMTALKGQNRTTLFVHVFAFLLIALLYGCGNGSDSDGINLDSSSSESAETGSAVFTIQWHNAPTFGNMAEPQAAGTLDCEDVGVATITCNIYDGSNNYLTSGGPWPCSLGSGTIYGIPIGQNRKFVILGEDAEWNLMYLGQAKNTVEINPGEIADVGTINAHSFIPTGLTAMEKSFSQIDLVWNAPNDDVLPDGYIIYRDGAQVGTSLSTSYNDTGLTQDTEYCYTVSSHDAFDNESTVSNQDCATTLKSFNWYRDKDEDGYGNPNDILHSETQPDGYVSDNSDCNDEDASVHPDAAETCNGIDDNCDGNVDEGVMNTYYLDADGDDYGDADNSTQACELPTGYVSDDTDCDDSDGTINPGETEINDGKDNDCDGEIDEDINLSAPVISNISQELVQLGTARCSDDNGITYSGTNFDIRFNYEDIDGDAHRDHGATVGSLDPLSSWDGDGYEGSVSMDYCPSFGESKKIHFRVSLTDGSGNESNVLTIDLHKPDYDKCYAQRIVADEAHTFKDERTFDLKESSGTFKFDFDTSGDGDDQIIVRYENKTILYSRCGPVWGSSGSKRIEYSGKSTEISVTVEKCIKFGKSSWEYTVNCPSE